MKRIVSSFLLFCLFIRSSNAQYCGNSGSGVCAPDTSISSPGLSPASSLFSPLINGYNTNSVIYIKNFDTLSFGGQTVSIISLTLDTIYNLPGGLCYATDKSNNTWGNSQSGCIKIAGIPCDTPGQYQLYLAITTDPPLNTIDGEDIIYSVRLINAGDSIRPVDTTDANSFETYNESANCHPSAINPLGANINDLKIFPNPFSTEAKVYFNSDKTAVMTEYITDVLDRIAYKKEMEVIFGQNTLVIERGVLTSGLYLYTLSDEKSVICKRFVISE